MEGAFKAKVLIICCTTCMFYYWPMQAIIHLNQSS